MSSSLARQVSSQHNDASAYIPELSILSLGVVDDVYKAALKESSICVAQVLVLSFTLKYNGSMGKVGHSPFSSKSDENAIKTQIIPPQNVSCKRTQIKARLI